MIHSLNPEQDVLPDEVMELAGAIYGGCIVSASLNIYVQKDKQGIRACLNAILLLTENLCSVALVVLLLGQKRFAEQVVLFEQVVVQEHLRVVLSVHLEGLPQLD
jgi:hypothetical protein